MTDNIAPELCTAPAADHSKALLRLTNIHMPKFSGCTSRYYIPAKTGVWTPWATVHNVDANWGPTAGQYLPERWLQPGSEYMQSPAAEEADERSGGDAGGGDNLKHATASTARNFEMGVSRVKVYH